jgi:hypothetical protein
MWRSKKFIVIASLVAVLLVGSIGGVVLAQTENEDDNTPAAQHEAMLARVCEIYNIANPEAPIDCEALKDAFTQAGSELRAEAQEKMAEARDKHLQSLIDEGKITQEQIDQFDAWLESKPEVPFVPGLVGPDGHRGFGGPGGGFPRWGGPPCAPQE